MLRYATVMLLMGHLFQKVNHSWTVKNFSHCYQEYLENFVYLSRGDETLTWSIKIYPKGNGENNKDFVFLCLNRVVSACRAPFEIRTPTCCITQLRVTFTCLRDCRVNVAFVLFLYSVGYYVCFSRLIAMRSRRKSVLNHDLCSGQRNWRRLT